MINVGIDTLALYTSRYVLDLTELAKARGVAADKYAESLGQSMMSVPPPGEDIITMAANAAKEALTGIDTNQIDLLIFATESATDQSKASGLYVHELLGLPSRCRVMEVKQACYAGTAALQLTMPYLREHPDKKVLVIASDIARYSLESAAESSQGCGAIAMVLSANPRLLVIEPEFGVMAENAMDFWRPNYLHEALVDGKYSSKLYLTMLEKTWKQYEALSNRHFHDHDYFCYHIPVPRLVEKAHQYLLKINGLATLSADALTTQMDELLSYGRQIGNSYTASLYVGLLSLLEMTQADLAGKRIGFYSYGSGSVAEYFSGIVQPGYQAALHKAYHTDLLTSRVPVTYADYLDFYHFHYVEDGSLQTIPFYHTGHFRLSQLNQHKRTYEHTMATSVSSFGDDLKRAVG